MSHSPLDAAALDQLFLTARTFGFAKDTWLDKPVSTEQLHRIWELARMGPTAANSSPARVAWVVSPEAKKRLAANIAKSARKERKGERRSRGKGK